MIQTVKISRLFRGDQETKYGIKPKVAIKVEEKGDAWLSTFKTSGTENWKEGDTVEIDITENNGFLNFTVSHKNLESTVELLETRVKKLEDSVFTDSVQTKEKEDETDSEENPF